MKKHIFMMSLLALMMFLQIACTSSSDSGLIDGDHELAESGETEIDAISETDFADGDFDIEITENEGDVEEVAFDLFKEQWWPMPDETDILDLLDKSKLFKENQDLILNMSSWFEVTDYEEPGEEVSHASYLGYYGIGNGVNFAFVGTDYPRNTIHGMIGPDYQKHSDGFFADFSTFLYKDEKWLRWTKDMIWKPRHAQIALTSMQVEKEDIELDTITFAPISSDSDSAKRTILQVLNIRNNSEQTVSGLSARVQYYTKTDEANTTEVFLIDSADNHKFKVQPEKTNLWQVIDKTDEGYPALELKPFSLEAGEEKQFLMIYEFSFEDETFGNETMQAVTNKGWNTLLNETIEWWENWFAQGMEILTPDQRVNDIIEGLKGAIKVQITEGGAVSPMSHYTSTWIRDSYAPVRTFLKFGYNSDAWGIMDYYFKASSVNGSISNAKDTNVEIPDILPEPDWYANMPFSGRLRGETASYISLMHTYYWKYTGEADKLDGRWDYLMHSLKGQGITAETGHEGLMYFSGDETFRPQLSANLELPGGVNYKFEELCYSANSAFIFVPALELLSEYATKNALDEADDIAWLNTTANNVRTATEDWYWLDSEQRYSPFVVMDTLLAETRPAEDVNTKPIWINYLDSESVQARQNILSVIDAIGQDNKLIQNVPSEPVSIMGFDVGGGLMTGMAPAYFLYNVVELNLEQVEQTFDTVGTYVSPSGNIHEVGTFPQPGVAFSPFYFKNGNIGELYTRYREWEGSILAESLMHFLIGYEADVIDGWLKLAPRLAHDSTWLKVNNIIYNGHKLDLQVDKNNNEYSYKITCEDDPATYNLQQYKLKLIVNLDAVSKVMLNDNELENTDYAVEEAYNGTQIIKLNVDATVGEMIIVVK